MAYPSSTVRLAIERAKEKVANDQQLPLYGALTFACAEIEPGNRDNQERLYKQAKLLIDQSERVLILDAALGKLQP
jgi:hypothetical protein